MSRKGREHQGTGKSVKTNNSIDSGYHSFIVLKGGPG